MLIEKYEADNIFMRVPGLTLKMNAELNAIDTVLEDEELFCMIRDDLGQRYPKTRDAGRHSTPVEVILRMLAVRYLYNWSYEKTEMHVADSLVLRQFCRVYFKEVPDHTTLCKWAQLIQPDTLAAFNARLMELAVSQRRTQGRKLRMDGMVVESNIHHPTDSSLLADGVRVLGRTLSRAKQVVGEGSELEPALFRNRIRSAKGAAREIVQQSRRGKEAVRKPYKRLLKTTQATIKQAEQVLEILQEQGSAEAQKLFESLACFLPRVQQVVEQAERRIFQDEPVPAAEKLVSLFEPHSDIIQRGKTNKPTEFGHKVWLGEVEGGFISSYQVLAGNPADSQQWQPTLEHHIEQFHHPPWQASADRGVFTSDNEDHARDLGIKRVILPKPGRKSQARRRHERQHWFRRGRRYHAGVEGRISVISRKHGLNRCRDKGEFAFHRWVGWGVIANNLCHFA